MIGAVWMSSRKLPEVPPPPKRPLTEKVSLERARWFDRNILPHEGSLCAWLRRRRLEPHEIDDVIQESYAILASRERLDDLVYPKAYLFRIAHSLVLRDANRARIVPFEPLGDMEESNQAVDPFSPERITIAREELKRLATVIQSMPTRVRAAFVLRRVHGLSQREIAERMDISESTVEKHISKGLALVIERFGRHSGNGAAESPNEGNLGNIRLGAGPRDTAGD
ncbi:MAG: RNA polymerase sigma factor [Pseudomonadota bacterium]